MIISLVVILVKNMALIVLLFPSNVSFFIVRSQSEPFMASIALFTATTNLDKLTYYISEQKYHLGRGWRGGLI